MEFWKLLLNTLLYGYLFSIYEFIQVDGKRIFPVGLILNGNQMEEEIAFRSGINRVNVYSKNFQFEPIIKKISYDDSYQMEKIMCDLISKGVIAIFGPNSIESGIASSTCNTYDIPNIIYNWIPDDSTYERNQRTMTLNVYPSSIELARGYADIVSTFQWKSYTIMPETNEELIQLQDVIQIHGPEDHPITVRTLRNGPDYRSFLKEIKALADNCFILHCNIDKIINILRQANNLNMLTEYQTYFFPDLDAHTVDFEDIRNSTANFTTVRLLDPNDRELRDLVFDWSETEKRRGRIYHVAPEHVRIKMVLIHDGVQMFASVLRDLNIINDMTLPLRDCRNPRPWQNGRKILEFMKNKTYDGISGTLQFNKYGERINFKLKLIEITSKGVHQLLIWDPVGKIDRPFANLVEHAQHLNSTIQNKIFRVVSRTGAPFLINKQGKKDEILEGNARFEGYTLDLIDAISKIVNFKYEFYIAPDNMYGSYNEKTKRWNGLIKELLDEKADLAICDLTITSARRQVVDFSSPFMTLGISILFAKPISKPPDLFSFLMPFSLSVWLYMVTSYLVVSLLIFALSRMAPDDWENPHPCKEEAEELENIWNISNTTWVTMGSIMGQGSDILPKAISTRLVTGVWWFFALMMLNSYTANLAAFLTMSRMDATIESAEDLAKQTKIKYGAVKDGSTLTFFKESNHTTYQKMWAAMENSKPSVFTKSNDEGVDRVLKGKRFYAFLMESTSLEYITERSCELTQIGGWLDYKSYGIAMPFNSPYRSVINEAILKLGESGKLNDLKKKWWKEMHGGGACPSTNELHDSNELGLDNVGGVFLVLGCGLVVALLIGIMEFIWNIRKVAIEEKKTPFEAFKSELIFALKFWVTSKPVNSSNPYSESTPSKHSSKSRSRAVSESHSNATNVMQSTIGFSLKSLQSGTKSKDRSYLI